MKTISKELINSKIKFIENYIHAKNAADGSKLDANANVSSKNLATLEAELCKDVFMLTNRRLICDRIEKRFGKELADEYVRQVDEHEIYPHDSTSLKPYCVSISMYPFLLDGLKQFGGESKAPKHLSSFNGGFVNLIFAIASQFAGAVASVEYLMYFDHFARKEYGDNYLESQTQIITQELQQVVYALNQPAAARGFQCVREDTTQLSTPEGYKYLSQLKIGDECYVWKDGKIKIEKIKQLNAYPVVNEELIQFKGRHIQQTVTKNHRVLYKVPNTNTYKLKEAKDLVGHSKLSIPIIADFDERPDFQISDDMIKLCVAVLCDGSFDNSNRINLYLSKNRWGFKTIPNILEKNGLGFSISETTENLFGEMMCLKIPTVDACVIGRFLKYTKTEMPHWVTLLSTRQARLFLETWSNLDGSKRNKGLAFQCDNENIADSIQHLCLIAGYGSEKATVKYNKIKNKLEKSDKSTWYVFLLKRSDKRVKEYKTINYTGNVWCPTTAAGVVIFREENGIPYISGNSVFWNISIFDKFYFDSMFGNFVFPDGTKPNWETTSKLQKYFMKWFNEERTKAVLTFPVVTAAVLHDGEKLKDEDYEDFLSNELAEGNSFFIFSDKNAYSLSSCCRLKNDVSDQINEFSYSLGAGGVMTGSQNVITININRLIQDKRDIVQEVQKVHKYQLAFNDLFKEYLEAKMMPVFDAGFISLNKQFLTIGINGVVEAAEYLGHDITDNTKYKTWVSDLLKSISDENKIASKLYGVKFNTEFIPGENLGSKFAVWDKKDGYEVKRDCYNSYLYRVEDQLSVLEKISLHGKDTSQYLDGGSALHCNLETYPEKETFKKLMRVAAVEGCNYYCFNVKVTCCEDCGHIDKRTHFHCTACSSKNVSHATRIIGYLKKIKDFSSPRQKEEALRFYHTPNRAA